MSALDALDEEQRAAARVLRGPVAVLAGAGSGKTRVITHRIAHGVDVGAFTPNRVMALTFTTKAAGELRGRLRALGTNGVQARTFHSAALAQLNYFWPIVAKGDPAPAILDGKVRLLAQAAEQLRLRPGPATLRDIASQIEWRKTTMRSIEQFGELGRSVAEITPQALVDLMTAYEKLKDERRQIDFEDVLLVCAGMIEAEAQVARAVREQYRHFTVDEYQDVSPLQNHLLDLWVGQRGDLCVVGDASQTIYSFAGADPVFLQTFERRHPDATVVRLQRNYRSRAPIIAAANALMAAQPGALRLRAVSTAPGETPQVRRYDDERAEAEGVAAAVARQLGQAKPSEIAVLYRSHAQSAELQQALARRGIPTTVLGGRRFFDLPEVQQAIRALRAAAVAPQSGQTTLVDAVRDVLRGLGYTDEAPTAGGAVRDAWEARRALLQLAENADEGTVLRVFADDLMARAKDQHEPTLATVTLATLHAAKGLEWPHVHLAGMAEGLLPISYATTKEAIDEERRLAYVGITRAEQTLSMSWAAGQGRRQRVWSRFLQEMSLQELGTGIPDEPDAHSTAPVRPE
ncbi:MAG: ATP-dependent helicase [Microbacterium sp.]